MMTDDMVAARVAALREERRGIENRIGKATTDGDIDRVQTLEGRLDAVDADIAKWSGEKRETRPAGRGKQARVKGTQDG